MVQQDGPCIRVKILSGDEWISEGNLNYIHRCLLFCGNTVSNSATSCDRIGPDVLPATAGDQKVVQAVPLLNLHSEHRIKGEDIDAAINTTMELFEAENEKFKDVFPKNYTHIDGTALIEIVRIPDSIPTIKGDTFGKT